MGVQFAAELRRVIVAATMLADARGQVRPRVRDLADVLTRLAIAFTNPPADLLDDDLEGVLGEAASIAGTNDVSVDAVVRALSALASPEGRQRIRRSGPTATPRVADTGFRVGTGFDSHRFAKGGPLVLGGVRIESDVHCAGHSDGDAACHALTDAILGAAGAGDIGEMFPDTDPANAGRNSLEMLRIAATHVRAVGYQLVNADITIITERPRIAAYRDAMRAALAEALSVPVGALSVKGKSNEQMGWIGRGEGLAVIAVASLNAASR